MRFSCAHVLESVVRVCLLELKISVSNDKYKL